MDYDYNSYDDDNPLGEPVENFVPMFIVPGDTNDYGGSEAIDAEEAVGELIASDDYANSNEQSVDSLGNIPDPDNAATYTDVYTN